MEPERLRTVTRGIPRGTVDEVGMGKKITIADNKVGREAIMINAPADFGVKEYYYCNFGTITVNLDHSAVTSTKSILRKSLPHFPAGLNSLPAKVISSTIESTRPSTPTGNSVQLYSNTGRKSGEAYAQICPELASNWISGDIVREYGLKSKQRETKKKAEYQGNLLISTRYLVEFICPQKPCRHRFHIIEDAPFQYDMLYGVEFVGEN